LNTDHQIVAMLSSYTHDVFGGMLMYFMLRLQRESFTHKMSDGWGLATDGKVLFGSDGTSRLYQLDPKSIQGNYSSDFVIPIGSCCST
jgi:hypothetical protein